MKPSEGRQSISIRCECGSVSIEAEAAPIMTVACYCHSCQTAAAQMESLPDAPALLDKDGGTHFVMYRKDRMKCSAGPGYLREHRLKPDSETRRVIAVCCNSPMFLEFEKGHWLSLYKDRFKPAERPALDMRTMTKDRRPDVTFGDTIPSPNSHTIRFMWNLMAAWVLMGFKVTKINYVSGHITTPNTERGENP